MPSRVSAGLTAALTLAAAAALAGCTAAAVPQRNDGVLDIVATTPILADLARNVAGDAARVTGLTPPDADVHSYEPTLRDVRAVANADIVLSNHLLLENQAMMDTVTSATRPGVPVVKLAEESVLNGGYMIPLVENVTLDTPWLGARAGSAATTFRATAVRGPGALVAYLTGTFGQPTVYINSADGLDAADTLTLPATAHTHLNWAFTAPGSYEMDVQATVDGAPGPPITGTVRFAVGQESTAEGIDDGHWDLGIRGDGASAAVDVINNDGQPAGAVVQVPHRALWQVPAERSFAFLGRPGAEVFVLPQAVLGKHVHGEMDPHLWQDVANAKAYVRTIRDRLTSLDPGRASHYHDAAQVYLERLDSTDVEVAAIYRSISPERRQLVTTHDGYAYLARAYDMQVAGFVSPNPGVEPSTRDIIALSRTLRDLHVPAVFLEPAQARSPGTLGTLARDTGVAICPIYSDYFSGPVATYIDLVTTNAHTIKDCLT